MANFRPRYFVYYRNFIGTYTGPYTGIIISWMVTGLTQTGFEKFQCTVFVINVVLFLTEVDTSSWSRYLNFGLSPAFLLYATFYLAGGKWNTPQPKCFPSSSMNHTTPIITTQLYTLRPVVGVWYGVGNAGIGTGRGRGGTRTLWKSITFTRSLSVQINLSWMG